MAVHEREFPGVRYLGHVQPLGDAWGHLGRCAVRRLLAAEHQIATAFVDDAIDALPESSLGLYIITSVMDTVEYEVYENSNILTMMKYLPKS